MRRYNDARDLPEGSRGTEKAVYAHRITQKGIDAAKQLETLALDKGRTTAQLAVAWVLNQPGITGVIIGPRTGDHFQDLLPAADMKLHEDDLKFCDTLVPPGAFVSDHFNTAGWVPA